MTERTVITIFGPVNAGKSTIANLLTGQDMSIISSQPGTTTDPVRKTMEINGIGPCVIVDTAGFDDKSEVGTMRVSKTKETLRATNIAIFVLPSNITAEGLVIAKNWLKMISDHCPETVLVTNDFGDHRQHEGSILINAKDSASRDKLLSALGFAKDRVEQKQFIVAHLVKAGDSVMLVMPQDNQAPAGRLILPQVQTIRELLDLGCTITCCTTENYKESLGKLAKAPNLIITDSQAFKVVYENKPADSLITSFSVLFAKWKGDIDTFVAGTEAFSRLRPNSKVLIAEACTHAPLSEDIGREKIPNLIKKAISPDIQFDIVSGRDWNENIEDYDLIIHCGACMINRQEMLSRIGEAKKAGVPITNYGITIAYFTKILDKIVY